MWEEQPFRPVRGDEDVWFLIDQARLGATTMTVAASDEFLAVRHAALVSDRGHTWTHLSSGTALDDDTLRLEPYWRLPEELLPAWAITTYRAMRGQGRAISPLR